MGLDKEAVRSEITIREFLGRHAWEFIPAGREHKSNTCPWCGTGNRERLSVSEDVAYCHSCGNGGDLFDVAAAFLELNPTQHFPQVLAMCAEAAGLDADGHFDKHKLERLRERRAKTQKREADRRAELRRIAERGAKELWYSLSHRSTKGQEYIAARGILPQHAGRELRYTGRSACLPLFVGGDIRNVVGRRFDGRLPKIRGLTNCGTRGTFGRPLLMAQHEGPIVIVEGFMDYLSARQMSPTRLVLGAHGCANLPYVAEVAAELIKGTFRGLVLVPDNDDAGIKAMEQARQAAIQGGVPAHATRVFNLLPGCKDLNDHLLANGRRAA